MNSELPCSPDQKDSTTALSVSQEPIHRFIQEGDKLFENGRYIKSLSSYRKALLLTNKSQPFEFNLHLKLGLASFKSGEYSEAIIFLTKALIIGKNLEEEDIISIAAIKRYFGEVYLARADYSKALEYFRESIEMIEKWYGNQDKRIMPYYNDMADLLGREGKYNESIALLEKTIKITPIQKDDKYEYDLSKSYFLIGDLYSNLGDYAQGLNYVKKSLGIRERLYGKDNHPEIAICYQTLGYIYMMQDKLKEALTIHNLSLKIRLEFFGEDHPHTSGSYNNIAMVQKRLRQFDEALDNYRQGLAIRIKFYGKNHPEIANIYNNIANVLTYQNKLDVALENYHIALDIRLALFGDDHPNIATCYSNIGNVYRMLKKYEKARESMVKSINLELKFFGINRPSIAMCYNNLGITYFEQKEFPQALKHHITSLKIRASLFGDKHSEVSQSMMNLGLVFRDTGNIVLSEACFLKWRKTSLLQYGSLSQFIENMNMRLVRIAEKKVLLNPNYNDTNI